LREAESWILGRIDGVGLAENPFHQTRSGQRCDQRIEARPMMMRKLLIAECQLARRS
jgi:hypothetical protein